MRPSSLIILLLAGLPPAAPAFAFVEQRGTFTAEAACPAFQSFRNETNPGAIETEPGRRYAAYGLNRKDGEWVQIEVAAAQPPTRWVRRDCGSLARADGDDEGGGTGSGFAPLFDTTEQQPVDMTPPPPPVDPFDEAVLELCGPWGSRPHEDDFRTMLDRPELAADVVDVYEALARSVTGRRDDLAGFKDQLARVWFAEDGFVHIFCGEPQRDELGGLHYRARYLDLQEKGEIGLMSGGECPRTEIEPPIYTVGLLYRRPDGGIGRSCVKGYAYDLNARGLLIEATEAFKETAGRRGDRRCFTPVDVGSQAGYFAFFYRKNDAIRTFYPDASPHCPTGGGMGADCPCSG